MQVSFQSPSPSSSSRLQGLINSFQLWYFCEILYCITATVLRVTVGIFLLRFTSLKSQRILIHGLNLINILYNVCYLATTVHQCIPLSYYWTRFDRDTKGLCFEPQVNMKMLLGMTVIAAATDWSFGLMPIWILWDSRLSRRKKVVVSAMLGLGSLYACYDTQHPCLPPPFPRFCVC